MVSTLFQLVGGIGLFLMGMALLTDGLKSFAGDALRRALLQFTGRPVNAFASGVLVTAVVQSSSATTVAVIGFVSAGLLAFPQAVGVVIGASLGTTATSWIVSVIGLKVSVGYYAPPLIGAGAFMKLLASRRALLGASLEIFQAMRAQLMPENHAVSPELHTRIEQAIEETQRFLARIPPPPEEQPASESFVAQIHAIDHLTRLAFRLRVPLALTQALSHKHLEPELRRTLEILDLGQNGLRGTAPDGWLAVMEEKSNALAARYSEDRPEVLRQTAQGGWEPALALNLLDAMRWLERIGYHTWRICHYLGTGKPKIL
jgi:uncharacterized membrane protein YhiD involved in acid resistance